MEEMTRIERVRAAVGGQPVDRMPLCFWHHFRPDGSGARMAAATLRFFDQEFDLDIVKIMPDLPYPFPRRAIHDPEDWRLIEPVAPDRGMFGQRLVAIRMLREALGAETPIILTIYNPVAEVRRFAADAETFARHRREHPAAVHRALGVIAENLSRNIAAAIDAGADGVYYALQGITADGLGEAGYREFGRPYDFVALRGAEGGWLNVCHVHGDHDLLMDLALDYPVRVLSWSDRLTGLSLREVRLKSDKCFMGGLHEFGALAKGDERAVIAEAQDAVEQTGGRKFILANGCSVPDETPHANLRRSRAALADIRPQ
jgi:uroporphyrinogen decarboxylase